MMIPTVPLAKIVAALGISRERFDAGFAQTYMPPQLVTVEESGFTFDIRVWSISHITNPPQIDIYCDIWPRILLDAARDACHETGLAWTDPRTGKKVYPHNVN